MPQTSREFFVPDVLPGQSVEIETEIKRSRFLACLTRVSSRAEALAFQQALKKRFPDASHHCLAFIAGAPEGGAAMGFDDDGEPGGTAGKPMLNVLQHKNIGEVVVVVVRYFGGVKLGAGGLVRAYGASVQAVCEALPVKQCVARIQGTIRIDYALEQIARHLLGSFEGEVDDCRYHDRAELQVTLAESVKDEFAARLTQACKGQVQIKWQE